MGKIRVSRRGFLKKSVAASALYSLVPHTVLGANARINIGMIGLGGMGGGHCLDLRKRDDCRVLAVSDADSVRMGKAPDAVKHQDFRRLLDIGEIDAVFIATPNHWHSLAAIMSMQAGKHVYVEKPVSHSIWEGRKMVEASRKYNCICQAGTQQASCPAVQAVARDVQQQKYGRVLWVHCSKLGSRKPISKVESPIEPPETVDYNLWLGPAPMTPVRRGKFHYDWHWQFNWGDGEMGNWAIHYLNDMRQILGWDDVPSSVMAAGGRFWDDDGNTPNIHMAVMKHRGVDVVVDIRNLPGARPGDGGAVYLGARAGNYIMCENGFIRIARGGGAAYDLNGERIKCYKGDGGSSHKTNFFDAVRSRDRSILNAEIEMGHQSTVMCHQANIAWRIGSESSIEEVREAVKNNQDAVNTVESIAGQLAANKIDFEKMPFISGPRIVYDNRRECFTGKHADKANKFVRLPNRREFTVPECV
ncbi:MAG: Gfo/Idh/MocA family oxidoreductase [Kiritimatiellia bacterium]